MLRVVSILDLIQICCFVRLQNVVFTDILPHMAREEQLVIYRVGLKSDSTQTLKYATFILGSILGDFIMFTVLTLCPEVGCGCASSVVAANFKSLEGFIPRNCFGICCSRCMYSMQLAQYRSLHNICIVGTHRIHFLKCSTKAPKALRK